MLSRRGILSLLSLAAIPGVASASGYVTGRMGYSQLSAMKPMAFGTAYNVGSPLLDSEKFIYGVSRCPVTAITGVYDRGMKIEVDGDEPDLGALSSADIAPGHARTCVADGSFRLGAVPCEPVTADVIADAYAPYPSQVFEQDDLAGAVSDERKATLREHSLLRERSLILD